jgi:hypothetical protein
MPVLSPLLVSGNEEHVVVRAALSPCSLAANNGQQWHPLKIPVSSESQFT